MLGLDMMANDKTVSTMRYIIDAIVIRYIKKKNVNPYHYHFIINK